METRRPTSELKNICIVLTVPMRNGNVTDGATPKIPLASSYRTYEEWKLIQFTMNADQKPAFLPYLWGMETRLNNRGQIYLNTVLTVPMRNGNITLPTSIKRDFIRSYRTYEEWKLLPPSISHRTPNLFLPYLWGMETSTNKKSFLILTLFLPYLWGMETSKSAERSTAVGGSYRTYEEWKLHSVYRSSLKLHSVLTVPMRNGNYKIQRKLSIYIFTFLPYLWGMETPYQRLPFLQEL
mgnify:CR=1 FL=1